MRSRPPRTRGRQAALRAALAGLLSVSLGASAEAAVTAPVFADASTRGFSVVWASDEAVSSASVSVFADSAGTQDLTSGLSIGAASAESPTALSIGVVRTRVSGLTPGTCVYIQTQTNGTGTVLEPPTAPFPQICTAAAASKQTPGAAPILNDLVAHDVLTPDQLGAANGALLLVSLPGISAHPISAFVGEGFASPVAVADLNNVISSATGTQQEIQGGEVLEIVEVRGLLCPGLQDHQLLRFRRAPDHDEVGAIGVRLIELEPATLCFATNTVCDDQIDILDVQHTLNGLGTAAGDCLYNADLDIDASGSVDAQDVQDVVNDFGGSAPFGGP
jgi:hypothetical protein